MKVVASILSILAGILQLIFCILLGKGRYVIDNSIEQIFYSGTLFFSLSCLLIILGALSLKHPRASGVLLLYTSTACFFLGSFFFAPIAFAGGVLGLFSHALKEKYNTKKASYLHIVIAVVGLATIIGGFELAIYMWNKTPTKVENVMGISITADQLTKEYTADEKAADAKYLNKAIEVSGTVIEVNNNQDGGIMLVLKSTDPTTCVQCTLRDKGAKVAPGQNVTVKGFCSGNGITGVTLTDCVLK
jgi:hypothetical protein